MKKLLMLGGSPSQVVAIKKAKEMGYYVITCDYLENNPGHQFSDEYHNVSTVDKEAVLALAKSLQIDGIICYAADSGALTVAYVAEHLGLPAFPYKSVEILSNKELFRSFLKGNNFHVPRAKGYSTLEEATSDFYNFKLPVMIKPIDASGSKGVSKIDSIELLQEKVNEALRFSRAKRFIVEEFIEKSGFQVGVDCFSINGCLVFSGIANHHFETKLLNPFLPIGKSFPTNMAMHLQEKVRNEIQRLIDLLHLKTGNCNVEVQIDCEDNVYILDIGVRNSADLTEVINHVQKMDLIEYTIKAALGEDCSDLMMDEPKGFGSSYVVINEKSGLFKGIEFESEFQTNNIVKCEMFVKSDDQLIKSDEKLARLILEFPSHIEMLDKMENISNLINIKIEESILENIPTT
ncbi:ATP-grasp domain-containing protein [Solibacillus cecembensis]|uniref:ATP-grasp domain-containing protein n=1 Tax=Solibacillus cecembensis TaxID=459347 RepID=UPI003D0760A6